MDKTAFLKGSLLLASLTMLLLSAHMAQAETTVPVLTQPVKRGDIVTEDMLVDKTLKSNQNRTFMVNDMEDVVGKEAKRNLRPGFPLYYRQFREVPTVRKGQTTTILYKRGRINLSAEGTVMNDAQEGDWVKVMNEASNQLINGQVLKNGTIMVN